MTPKTLLLLAVICTSFDSGPVWGTQTTAKAGETISISWEYAEFDQNMITGWNLYRQTGVSSTETKLATGDPATRQFDVTMPIGTTKRYRFVVRPVIGTDIGPAGVEVIVNRVK